MSHRVYLFDADTGEELAGFCCTGTAEAGIYKGHRYIGTHLGFGIVEGKKHRALTADDYPGRRIVAKLWYPGERRGNAEWKLLVSRAKGWQGNEADIPGGIPHAPLPRKLQGVLANCKRAIYRKKAA